MGKHSVKNSYLKLDPYEFLNVNRLFFNEFNDVDWLSRLFRNVNTPQGRHLGETRGSTICNLRTYTTATTL